MELKLQPDQWEMMKAHVEMHAPLEACGILAGKNNNVEKVFPITNQAKSRVRFRMNPKEQLDAFNWIESNRLEFIAIFHSHPAGPETVSVTDIEEAAYPVIQIIWSRAGGIWKARGFWIEEKQFSEVTLTLTDNQ